MIYGEQFYPTPKEVIAEMIRPLLPRLGNARKFELMHADNPRFKSFLDPSAGDGAILEAIQEEMEEVGRWAKPKLNAIEISPELCAILQSKGFDVIDHDFLEFVPERSFDLIVMNPPFANGIEHLLKAWEILEPGGELVCLLSEANLTNPHTKAMHLALDLIGQHGSWKSIGSAFAEARRETDVLVALVRMSKPKAAPAPTDGMFEDLGMDQETEGPVAVGVESAGSSEIAFTSRMDAVVRQYQMTKESFADVLKAKHKVRFFAQGACLKDPWELALKAMEGSDDGKAQERFVNELRGGFWEYALKTLGIEKYLTENLLRTLDKFIEQQSKMAFTKANIERLFETMVLNRHAIMKQAVEAVFDSMTKYHEENRVHVEGWKSNSAWKVSRTVVLPFMVQGTSKGGIRTNGNAHSKLCDIDKVMCWLSGKPWESITPLWKAIDELVGNQTSGESTFFKFRGYKKGTLHLTFLDESLWNSFNIEACNGKGWIGKEPG